MAEFDAHGMQHVVLPHDWIVKEDDHFEVLSDLDFQRLHTSEDLHHVYRVKSELVVKIMKLVEDYKNAR